MKNTIRILLVVVAVVLLSATLVSATSSSELADKLYAMTKDYGATTQDKVKVEKYLAENPVTDAEANDIIAKVEEIIAIADEEGVTDLRDLSAESKETVMSIANDIADIVDVKLDFSGKGVVVYDADGNKITSFGEPPYTGATANVILVVSIVAIIALATAIVAKKENN